MKTKEEYLIGVQFPASRSPRDFNMVLIAMQQYAEDYYKMRAERDNVWKDALDNTNIAQAVLLVLAQIKHNEECGKDNKFTIAEVAEIIKKYVISPVDDVKLSQCPECGYANGHIRGCQWAVKEITDEEIEDEEWHQIHDDINEERRNGGIE